MRTTNSILLWGLITAFFGCSPAPSPGTIAHIEQVTSQIDDQYLVNAENHPENWVTYGRTYKEDRYSPLNGINANNINELGLAWTTDLGTKRGIEATPLVVDGIMFLTSTWSKVHAINTRSGEILWTYDPKVPRRYGEKLCCDVINRGVALYKGMVIFGTLDGRLIALDAGTGTPVWEAVTVDQSKHYSISGAPRIVKGNVVIGNGGAEFGVRGYVSAYDAMTGEMKWRFYTVPGDPSQPFESEALEMAVETWDGEWWKYGGGGTAWDSMVFDPDANLLYIGTGNGSPWNRIHRSNGQGDNLFLSSILALDPDDGTLVWHYQTTPGEHWDYTATQPMVLADLPIDGQEKKVIMQAPKNGFFYVIDRLTGELLSAEPYTYINWATQVDMKTGRPVETEFSRYKDENVVLSPGPNGAHNWHPMAFNPETRLMYIPVQVNAFTYGHDPDWKPRSKGINIAALPNENKTTRIDPNTPDNMWQGMLLAWDPKDQTTAWEVPHEAFPVNGGILTTAGGLVFQGTADGRLVAYHAKDGSILWEFEIGSGMIAPPITYEVDGKQYLSIAVGWGGGIPALWSRATEELKPGTVYTFAIGANESLPTSTNLAGEEIINMTYSATKEELEKGMAIYDKLCVNCHGWIGMNGGSIPNLGYITQARLNILEGILLQGVFAEKGMPDFSDRLNEEEVQLIRNYILAEAEKLNTQE